MSALILLNPLSPEFAKGLGKAAARRGAAHEWGQRFAFHAVAEVAHPQPLVRPGFAEAATDRACVPHAAHASAIVRRRLDLIRQRRVPVWRAPDLTFRVLGLAQKE